MKNLLKYVDEKLPFKREMFFLALGFSITFFSGSKDPQISISDIEKARSIAYGQGQADLLSHQKNALADSIRKSRSVTLPVILKAPHVIDSLERELRRTQEELNRYKAIAAK